MQLLAVSSILVFGIWNPCSPDRSMFCCLFFSESLRYRLFRAWELWWPRILTMLLAALSCWTTTQGIFFFSACYKISLYNTWSSFASLFMSLRSIPFSVDDISKSMKQVEIADIDPPPLIRENSGFGFLLPRPEWCVCHGFNCTNPLFLGRLQDSQHTMKVLTHVHSLCCQHIHVYSTFLIDPHILVWWWLGQIHSFPRVTSTRGAFC